MSPQLQQRELEESWKGWELNIRRKLEELDSMTRQMISEMGTFGISQETLVDFLPQEFERLKREVVEKGNEKRRSRNLKGARGA